MTEAVAPPGTPEWDGIFLAPEREMLGQFLDQYRSVVVNKVAGLGEEAARKRLVESATTLGGVIKHLRWVEMNWFQERLEQRPASELPPVPWTDADPDADFRLEPAETLGGVIAEYQAACAESRSISARHDLDEMVPHHRLGRVSHRWILIHMIEETARHAGHLDILREQLDGTTGD